jgi:hypothetical protein
MKYLNNAPLKGRGGIELTNTEVEGEEPKPVTPSMVLKMACNSYPAEKVEDWRPVNALLDTLEDAESKNKKVLEVESQQWNTIKTHLSTVVAQLWRTHSTYIWDEIEDRMESERIKREEK